MISVICNKHYVTYNIARNMIQYEQGNLYYALKVKQAPVIWKFTIRKATVRKAGKSLRSVRNFPVRDKLNYLRTHRVYQESFTVSQKLFLFLPSRFLQSFCCYCSFTILLQMSWNIVLRHVWGDEFCMFVFIVYPSCDIFFLTITAAPVDTRLLATEAHWTFFHLIVPAAVPMEKTD